MAAKSGVGRTRRLRVVGKLPSRDGIPPGHDGVIEHPEEDEGVGRAALVIDVRLLLLTSAARLPEHAGAVGDPVVQRGLHMNDDLPHAATPGSTWPQPAFADGGMLWLWWNVFCGS